MVDAMKDGLDALERIIAKAADRRVEKIIEIAFLEVDDLSSIEARADLIDIENLLRTIQRQWRLLIASVRRGEAVEHGASLLEVAA